MSKLRQRLKCLTSGHKARALASGKPYLLMYLHNATPMVELQWCERCNTLYGCTPRARYEATVAPRTE